jgi:hypothetical protein
MRLFVALSRLLTILAIAGLVMGAAIAPVTAGVGGAGIAMSDEMPDCEGKAPDCGDTKSCPLMIVCLAKIAQNVPSLDSLVTPLSLALMIAPRHDRIGESRAIAPLPRPPEA